MNCFRRSVLTTVAAGVMMTVGLLRLIGVAYAQQQVCPPSEVPPICPLQCMYLRTPGDYLCSTKEGPTCCQYRWYRVSCLGEQTCWGTWLGKRLVAVFYGVTCQTPPGECPGFSPQ